MLKHFLMWTCVGLFLATPVMAAAQAQDTVINQVTLQGTVQAVDHERRTVTVRGTQGNIVTLDVPTSVTRFDEVKVGDTIRATYSDRVSVRLHPEGEPPIDRVTDTTTTPAPGAPPGASATRAREQTVTVTAWDVATKMVSFTSPSGVSYTRRVVDSVDPTVVAALAVGRQVDIVRTEATSVNLEFGIASPAVAAPAAAAAVGASTLDHRFTVSFQWGPDNSISGKMVEQATGQTVNGVPINLQDTSYDDVYGTMNVFKVGVGWRTTARSEFVFNFVRGSSGSDNAAVPIGTAGALATVPLDVQFSDYKYWGFDAGQRFYMTRARFTPYLGYLVGAIRYDDITGNFVGVPLELTPGLAAQDGKFFEKSWAFTVGPAAGFLVGLGPIEVTGEVDFIYTGGLSDVDWLVEESLRDINTKSERWSFPVLFGARVRF
ncbi:MAG TPA: hypothetical protein VH436_01785 [Vicinamibacterales bacterium]